MKTGILILFLLGTVASISVYKIGLGRADCTGPPNEIRFMGYANLEQQGHGIHLRQFSRAFIVEDDDGSRVVFASVDAAMMSHVVRRDVVAELQRKFGNMYNFNNVMISGTHTHSAPGGFMMHLLYDISILGYVAETKDALVRGITQSIVNAHNNMQDGRIFISDIHIDNANINRSPTAYRANPEFEKDQYDGNTDKKLTQLRFMDKYNSRVLGAFNWYAVHPTSMNMTNKLISSDNVGYASVLLEQEYNIHNLVGKGDFIGAVSSANLGDVSPNIAGPRCIGTGLPCDENTSQCPNKDDKCIAFGPGRDMFESTQIIATRIYNGASKLLREKTGREITGSIKFIHQFVDMPNVKTNYTDPKTGEVKQVRGCLPAMGYSFAAGTTDGPGTLGFEQSETSENPLWNAVRNLISKPTDDDKACHAPKPILLNTGRATLPYEWQPKIVPTQVFVIGDLVLAGLPGEFTTMSGRRMRAALKSTAKHTGNEVEVILAGLSNIYTSYIATPEEYQVQRYEGASTIYGPHTLTIYLQQYQKLLASIFNNVVLDEGPQPPYLDSKQINLNTGVVYDGHPIGKNFGHVLQQPFSSYNRGELVYARFVSGNPRNNHMLESSFFFVEKQLPNGEFEVVATDANWETRFQWVRTDTVLGFSQLHFYWNVPDSTALGTYRVRHVGYEKNILGKVSQYQGITNMFNII